MDFRLIAARSYAVRVLDADTGRPIVGVLCESFLWGQGREVVARRTTDAAGRVVVPDLADRRLDTDIPIRFTKAGYSPVKMIERHLLRGRSAARPLDIYLFRAGGLRLRVVDERRRPVAGADVRAWSGRAMFVPSSGSAAVDEGAARSRRWEFDLGRGKTDEKGIAALGATDEQWFAVARAEGRIGFGSGGITVKPRDDGARGEIRLHPAGDVVGRGVDEDGLPVQGAWVEWTLDDVLPLSRVSGRGGLLEAADHVDSRHVIAGEDGRFLLKTVPVPDDGTKLDVHAIQADSLGSVTLAGPAGGTSAEVTIAIRAVGEPVRVKVLDDLGRPLAGALVTWDHLVPQSRTGPDGIAVRARHPHGEGMRLCVRATGFGRYERPVPAGTADVEVRLARSRSLTGRVFDDRGAPVAAYVDVFGPEVGALAERERSARHIYDPGWLARGESGETGWFAIEGLPPGPLFVRAWVILANAGTGRYPSAEGLFAKGAPCELRIPDDVSSSRWGRDVTGAVFAADGTRITRYHVRLERPGLVERADQNGYEFRFTGVAPGTYWLVGEADQAPARGRSSVVVGPDADVEGVRLVLAAPATFAARLAPTGGATMDDLGGILVAAFRAGASEIPAANARTDATGRFRLTGVEPGEYRLTLAARPAQGLAWHLVDDTIRVEEGEAAERALAGRAGGRLVLVLDDARFASGPVDYERAGDPTSVATFGAQILVDGAATGPLKALGLYAGSRPQEWALPAGDYRLEIRTKAQGSFVTSFRIVEGRDATVRVELR